MMKEQYRSTPACADSTFAGHAPRHDRADCGADAARREKHADSGRRALADRKDAFSKNGQQRENSAANSPSRFDEQQREHARPILT